MRCYNCDGEGTIEWDEDSYEDYLNDVYGDVDICGYKHGAGSVLREIDLTAFRCGISDDAGTECPECLGSGEVDDDE